MRTTALVQSSLPQRQPLLLPAAFQTQCCCCCCCCCCCPLLLQALRPKLNDEQKQQLEECFELMDADGSGAIDADELGAAFKVCAALAKLHYLQVQSICYTACRYA
jgi:hypothetical protein